MKIIKIIASFLLILGILVLMVWAAVRAKEHKCTEIAIEIHASKEPALLSKSDILSLLERNGVEWKGKPIKEIDLSSIKNLLSRENYIKSVDKVHFLGSKLQVEVSLYNILMELESQDGKKFLLDTEGVYLPYSPKTGSDIIIATGFIPYTFRKKETVAQADKELYELFSVASLIREDSFYAALFHKLYMTDKGEIVLYPSVGQLPVLFGTLQDAESKIKTLKYMYEKVIPYMDEDKYAQLDVRFKNRIVATKTKT